MRFEVLSKDDMNELSRQLSRAGIMNRKIEEVKKEVSHYVVIKGKYGELFEKAEGIEPLEDSLYSIRGAYQRVVLSRDIGDTVKPEELLEELDGGLALLEALMEEGALEESDEELKIVSKPSLENLKIELRFPLDELEEDLEKIEERFNPRMVTEVAIMKAYYVEVLEVDRELIEAALEIAKEYATEESYVEAMFVGISRSVLADVILKLAEKVKRKDELIEKLLEMEPISVDGEKETVQVYFDEEAIESFLKELQSLGYLKVKGNRIWA
ncbi:hypothetical protein X802_05980 [Thermococcus guaymasensis DSM 11113]|uniref:Uncharacterized protein n=1 Tax=Thermococcus guaymasensis DSM 11113 TaxID=1432656 RepID=A0A0X1KKJ3_9EURY|nr:hypothetical protein [Thermococcus guaymasensis]AJC71755.1 hypothetical protein X802_05980 [Thermococcus guaymasensis DSM 11113]